VADPKVVREILRVGRRKRASPKEVKAAIETGVVESGLRNLPGGDADSAGWRQERASLYRDPTSVTHSAERFFDEARAHNRRGASAGQLAADVQRPRADLRGKYGAVAAQAEQILHGLSGVPYSPSADAASQRVELGHRSEFDSKAFEDARRRYVLGMMIARHDPKSILLKTGVLSQTAPNEGDFQTDRLTSKIISSGGGRSSSGGDGSAAAAKPRGHGPLRELFWQGPGGINAKNGAKVPQGFVSGHTDHVHVAAGPHTVVRLGRLAQEMGLHVGENPHFGTVHPVHVQGSYHYKGEAIDVSGDPALMRKFAHRVANMFGVQ
jgi:hypothetical protein